MEFINKLILSVLEFSTYDLRANFENLYQALKGFFSYETAEHATGAEWASSATVYQKIVTITAFPNATTANHAHGIVGLAKVLNYRAVGDNGTTQFVVTYPYVAVNDTNIVLDFSFNASAYAGFCILEYTKA